MPRRWSGLIVLLVAVIAALAGASRTKELAGVPRPGSIPGPPSIGDCLLDPGPLTARRLAVLIDLPIERCSGARYGEVVAVYDSPTNLSAAGRVESQISACGRAVDRFLGQPAPTDVPGWRLAPGLGAQLVEPTALQVAFGQKWRVCLVKVFGATEPYAKSLAGNAADQRFPAQLARCVLSWAEADIPAMIGSCSRPHPAEVVGSRTVLAPQADPAELLAGCRAQAAIVMGRADPTGAGALQLAVKVTGLPLLLDSGAGRAPSIAIQSDRVALCLVRPSSSGELTGPVLDIGDGVLPLG